MARIQKMLPACGFAIAAALVALTSAFKEVPKTKSGDPMYTFQYNAPGGTDYSASSVQKVTNWSYTTNTNPCDGHNSKACKIQVSEDFVDNPSSSTPALDESIDIVAGGTTTAYVSGTADNDAVISNKLN